MSVNQSTRPRRCCLSVLKETPFGRRVHCDNGDDVRVSRRTVYHPRVLSLSAQILKSLSPSWSSLVRPRTDRLGTGALGTLGGRVVLRGVLGGVALPVVHRGLLWRGPSRTPVRVYEGGLFVVRRGTWRRSPSSRASQPHWRGRGWRWDLVHVPCLGRWPCGTGRRSVSSGARAREEGAVGPGPRLRRRSPSGAAADLRGGLRPERCRPRDLRETQGGGAPPGRRGEMLEFQGVAAQWRGARERSQVACRGGGRGSGSGRSCGARPGRREPPSAAYALTPRVAGGARGARLTCSGLRSSDGDGGRSGPKRGVEKREGPPCQKRRKGAAVAKGVLPAPAAPGLSRAAARALGRRGRRGRRRTCTTPLGSGLGPRPAPDV